MKDLPGLVLCLGAALVAGALGALASVDAASFYAQLARPAWAPPAGVFGPVWTTLYVLMGISAWLVWKERRSRPVRAALTLYFVQLIVNALWSWLFFAWRQGALAFVEVVVLLALIAATLAAFWRVRPLAGALLVPNVLWVSFATALTWTVWKANPALLG